MIIRPDRDLTKDEVKDLNVFSNAYIELMFNAGQEVVKRKCIEYIRREGITKYD